MNKAIKAGFALLLMALVSGWIHGRSVAPSTNDLMIGAGGDLTNLSIAADGTMVVKTDTYGAYKWLPSTAAPNGTTGTWQQMVTTTSMGAQFAANGQVFQDGPYEVQVCYSNSSIMYMMYLAYGQTGSLTSTIYKSTDGGNTWVATGFTPVAQLSGNVFPYKGYGPKIAIDPQDCTKVFVSTSNSLLVSSNGGTSFTPVSTAQVPAANGNGYFGLQVHPTNSLIVYVFSSGSGVYKSADGGTTWTHLTTGTGPPTTDFKYGVIDPNNGVYYAISPTLLDLWTWNGTTWTRLISGSGNSNTGAYNIAVDTTTSGHAYVITPIGSIGEITNSNSVSALTTSGNTSFSTTGDVGWLDSPTPIGTGVVQANTCFLSPLVAKTLFCATFNQFFATSPWTGSIGSGTAITWNGMGRGIEQLVAQIIVSSPQYSTPFTGSWDRPVFHPNLTSYPSVIAPVNDTLLSIGYSIDYDSTGGTNTVCAVADGAFYGNSLNRWGCTTNGSTWTLLPNVPSISYPTHATGAQTANLALSSSTNAVFGTTGTQPVYTTNLTAGTITYNSISCAGVASWTGFMPGNPFNGWGEQAIAADRVNAGQFLMYVDSIGFFKLTSGGATCAAGAAISGVPGGGAGFNNQMQLKSVPGVANEYWAAVGNSGGPGQQPPNLVSGLAYTTDGGSTFNGVTNMTAAQTIGFGLHAVGQTHPAVYVVGWYKTSLTGQSFTIGSSGTASITVPSGLALSPGASLSFSDGGANGQWGMVSTYNNSTGALVFNRVVPKGSGTISSWTFTAWGIWQCTVSCTSATPAWSQIVGWPVNSFDFPVTISGDANILNRVYVGFSGSGFAKFNFLLKRDLDPASNDNDPMWLEKAA